MDNNVKVFGFDEEALARLAEAMPEDYQLNSVDNVVEMIVTSAMCYIASGDSVDGEDYVLLHNYCTEVAAYANELFVWVGDDPPCEIIPVYDDLDALILDLPNILNKAKQHYETQEMYSAPYALLPKRAIEASLEEAISASLQWRFPKNANQRVVKQMRQEWISLLEADAAVELAAVHELSIWLRRNDVPYFMEGGVTSGLIPYLLGITKVNPLSEDLGGCDLVWQSFCSYGKCSEYLFHLPGSVKERIERWVEKHWIKELYPDGIEDVDVPDFNTLTLMHMHFCFDVETTVAPSIPEYCLEDVYYYLLRHGFVEKDAFRGMESVRKGFGFPLATDEMLRENDPVLELGMLCRYLPARSNLMERLAFAESKDGDSMQV